MPICRVPGRAVLHAILTGLLLLVPGPSPGSPADFVPWRADHHMHLRSRAAYEAMTVMCAGVQGCAPEAAHGVLGAADALAVLDEAHVNRGVVLSVAYLFGSPFLARQHLDVARLTRAENEYVAAEVARSGGRLTGFFAVDPLQPSAAQEVRHWVADGRLQGLKLHLTSAGLNFKDPAQVKQLAGIVRLAGEAGLPLLIHLRTGPDFGAAQTEIFVRDVLPAAGGSTVQIAHAGGWSGTDQATLAILAAFAAHIARDDPATRHVLFDLSAVVTPATTQQQAGRLVELMRAVGLTRFVMGSDWDFATPRATLELMVAKLPLSAPEWQTLARNCAPWAC
jgi:predicted TIM-barrel fold metal-dependent hydrolase